MIPGGETKILQSMYYTPKKEFTWDFTGDRADQGPDGTGTLDPTRHEGAGRAWWQELLELGALKRLRREGQKTYRPATLLRQCPGCTPW